MSQTIFTPRFAQEMSARLLEEILSRVHDPELKDLLHCQSYFSFYAQQLHAGQVDALVEADAPAWLGHSLELIEARHAS